MVNGLVVILLDYIEQCETISDIDDELLYLAKIHNIEGIVYNQTKCEALKDAYYSTFLKYKCREKYISEIESAFSLEKIDYFFVKGHIVSEYYPQPFLKTMSDSDIVIHIGDRDRAKSVLEQNGFLFFDEGKAEWKFIKNGIAFELHYSLLYEDDDLNRELNDEYPCYFSKCWDYVSNDKLDDSFHFLFMIIHLRKHIFYQGAGFRLFLDMAFFLNADLDYRWIKKQLQLLKLESFAGVVFGLIKAWWNIDSVFAVDLSDDVVETITKKVSDGGVFGREDNKSSSAEDKIIKKSLFSYITSRLFRSYEFFQKDEDFSFMKGRPYLLPIGWIVHFVRSVKRSVKYKDYLEMKLPSKSRIRMREEELVVWGLKDTY